MFLHRFCRQQRRLFSNGKSGGSTKVQLRGFRAAPEICFNRWPWIIVIERLRPWLFALISMLDNCRNKHTKDTVCCHIAAGYRTLLESAGCTFSDFECVARLGLV
jgi:hypothetical protein